MGRSEEFKNVEKSLFCILKYADGSRSIQG